MGFESILAGIQSAPGYAGQILHTHVVLARPARFGGSVAELGLAPSTVAALGAAGISELYSHQADALHLWRQHGNPLVVTGTASGKSLCFLMPLLELLAREPDATALLLFPTKALSQDQALRLREALEAAGLADRLSGVFDGDTSQGLRRSLRDHASVLVTNPDMLHAGILPQHARWASFFARLRLVVVDELHVYNGILGSNAAHLFHRVARLCTHYGSSPSFVACSATIGNPEELAHTLMPQVQFSRVADDGSPQGERTYVLWNPPILRNTRVRSRRSANVEAQELMAHLISCGVRTITFSKAKMVAEMIHRYVVATLSREAPHLVKRVAAYRGGYLAEDRRQIEARLFSGELMGVSTTRALELGIDVGGLDACILVGYPGSLAGFFQQTGRAGRSGRAALCILVGLDTAVNQYVMDHPEYLFGRPIENVALDPANPFIVMGHLRCAAHEQPLTDSELTSFGLRARSAAEILESNAKLAHIDAKWYHSSSEFPQHEVSLRDYSDASVAIHDIDTGLVLGQLDKLDAPPILHPEAIYMHQGDTYRVVELDLPRRLCYVKHVEVDYYTQALGGTDVHHIDHKFRERAFGSGTVSWGEVTASFGTWGYEKVRFYELDAISRHPVDLAESELETMAMWIVPPEALMKEVLKAGLDPHSGLKGIGFAVRMMLPLFVTCDTLDFSHSVGCVNAPWNAIFVYERYLWGLGFTEKAYDLLHLILPSVLKRVRECPCADGCPCCVGKPLRQELTWNVERGEATIPSKAAAVMVMEGLMPEGAPLEAIDISRSQGEGPGDDVQLEQALRRRLERMREPRLPHVIDPQVPLAYPHIEAAYATPSSDAEARGVRRQDFNRRLRKRLASSPEEARLLATGQGPPVPKRVLMPTQGGSSSPTPTGADTRELPGAAEHVPSPTLPASTPRATPAVQLGDSLAALARRRRKLGTEATDGETNPV